VSACLLVACDRSSAHSVRHTRKLSATCSRIVGIHRAVPCTASSHDSPHGMIVREADENMLETAAATRAPVTIVIPSGQPHPVESRGELGLLVIIAGL